MMGLSSRAIAQSGYVREAARVRRARNPLVGSLRRVCLASSVPPKEDVVCYPTAVFVATRACLSALMLLRWEQAFSARRPRGLVQASQSGAPMSPRAQRLVKEVPWSAWAYRRLSAGRSEACRLLSAATVGWRVCRGRVSARVLCRQTRSNKIKVECGHRQGSIPALRANLSLRP